MHGLWTKNARRVSLCECGKVRAPAVDAVADRVGSAWWKSPKMRRSTTAALNEARLHIRGRPGCRKNSFRGAVRSGIFSLPLVGKSIRLRPSTTFALAFPAIFSPNLISGKGRRN